MADYCTGARCRRRARSGPRRPVADTERMEGPGRRRHRHGRPRDVGQDDVSGHPAPFDPPEAIGRWCAQEPHGREARERAKQGAHRQDSAARAG